jgi:hypothetical protein
MKISLEKGREKESAMRYIIMSVAMSMITISDAAAEKSVPNFNMVIYTNCYVDKTLVEKVSEIEDKEEREKYLVEIAQKDIDKGLKKDNPSKHKEECLKKTTAIRLLGKTPGTNYTDVLIQELTFSDHYSNNSTYPAIDALVDKGEKVTNILWNVVEKKKIQDGDSFRRVNNSGAALELILGKAEFSKSLEKHKDKIPKQTYQLLLAGEGLYR